MAKNLSISNFKLSIPLVTILIGMLIVEMFVHFFITDRLLNPTTIKIQGRVLAAELGTLEKDILIMGDSSAGYGINPYVLEKQTGLSVSSFNTPARTLMVGNYFILKKYIESGSSSPDYILLMNVYDSWQRDLDDHDVGEVLWMQFTEDMFSPSVFFSLNWEERLEYVILVTRYVLPSQRARWDISRNIRALVKGKSLKSTIEQNKMQLEESIMMLVDPISITPGTEFLPESTEKDLKAQLDFTSINNFNVSYLSDTYFKKFLELAEQNNINVFYCYPPILDQMLCSGEAVAYLDEVKLYICSVINNYPNASILYDDYYYVPIEGLSNTIDHLHTDYAIQLTTQIAKSLQ